MKNLEWLKKEVKNYIEPYDEEDWLSYKAGTTDVAELILGYIDQVEQPELPEIPDYVAEWIDTNKEKYDLVQLFWEIGEGGLVNLDVDRWIEENPNTFARAWLDGYTVEEKKYVVPLGELHALCKLTYDTVDIYKEDSDKLHLDDDFIFTEQEIKDYDERFWAFAKPIEELEE